MGRVNKKLLTKTLRNYFWFCLVVFLILMPLFFILIRTLYVEETDEVLEEKLEEFSSIITNFEEDDIENWNKYNYNILILPNKESIKEETFSNQKLGGFANDDEELFRVLEAPIEIKEKPYTLQLKDSLIENEDLLVSIALSFVGMLFILFIGLYFFTKKMSNKLWQPFYHILNNIEQFDVDKKKSIQSIHTDIEEFSRLNISLEQLSERNIKIFNSQKEFIENASHELQTPLAVFKSKVERLIQEPELSESQALILEEIHTNLNRMTRLNKNLLFLSKLDNNQYKSVERFDVVKVINKQLNFFKEQALSKSIIIHFNSINEKEIQANQILFETLLGNFLSNAIKYNKQNGEVFIDVTAHQIEIKNTSEANEIEQSKLFQRFSKADYSTQGTGLGLAIIKKIADVNNWQIQYSFQNNLHSFSLQF